jgi:hypothetical protein
MHGANEILYSVKMQGANEILYSVKMHGATVKIIIRVSNAMLMNVLPLFLLSW